jgi:hypothetical protein
LEIQGGLKPFGIQPCRLAKSALCVLAVAQLLFSSILSSSPWLHKVVHHDSDSPSHHCLATLMANGQVDQADANPVLTATPVVFLVAQTIEPLLSESQRDLRLPSGRAPPLV